MEKLPKLYVGTRKPGRADQCVADYFKILLSTRLQFLIVLLGVVLSGGRATWQAMERFVDFLKMGFARGQNFQKICFSADGHALRVWSGKLLPRSLLKPSDIVLQGWKFSNFSVRRDMWVASCLSGVAAQRWRRSWTPVERSST